MMAGDREVMGPDPDAQAAAASVATLRAATQESTEAAVRGLQRRGDLDDDASLALLATLTRLREGDECGLPVIEPEFFAWYFGVVEFIEAGRTDAAAAQARRLPLVASLPLAAAGLLEGRPLEVRGCDDLVLSEREWPLAVTGLGHRCDMWTDGDRLHLVGPSGRSEVNWRDVMAEGTFAIPGVPTILRQSGGARHREVAKYEADLSRVHERRLAFHLLPPEMFERQPHRLGRYAEGFACIANLWPELHAEVAVLTHSISALEGVPFVGGSDVACFGASFLALDPEWSDVCYADHIVHEAAHQRFHAEFEVEPALLNPAEVTGDSPIRRDPRPMEGSFHATFVFVRLAQFFERVMHAAPTHDAETRLHRHLLGAYTGVEMLDRHARFTDRGAAFFEALVAETDRMRRALPHPDPALYEAIASDYERPSRLASALVD